MESLITLNTIYSSIESSTHILFLDICIYIIPTRVFIVKAFHITNLSNYTNLVTIDKLTSHNIPPKILYLQVLNIFT